MRVGVIFFPSLLSYLFDRTLEIEDTCFFLLRQSFFKRTFRILADVHRLTTVQRFQYDICKKKKIAKNKTNIASTVDL